MVCFLEELIKRESAIVCVASLWSQVEIIHLDNDCWWLRLSGKKLKEDPPIGQLDLAAPETSGQCQQLKRSRHFTTPETTQGEGRRTAPGVLPTHLLTQR